MKGIKGKQISANQTQPDSSHSAIAYLSDLLTKSPSIQLTQLLSSYRNPKSIDAETFVVGVKKFIALANSNPKDEHSSEGRKALYGNEFLGLHYNNDLAKLWNSHYGESATVQAMQVSSFAPQQWDSIFQDEFKTLVYRGHLPAQALDVLVQGPSVIDCGMYTQLSLWFGIRYMLGDDQFNQRFGHTPFYLTQSVYNGIENAAEPYSGNPLYSFSSTLVETPASSVTVKHVANTVLYRLKHPGGNYGGENCVVIDGRYYIFDPFLSQTQGMEKEMVHNLLRESFNSAIEQCDIDRLEFYAKQPEQFHPRHLKTYGQLIEIAGELSEATFTEDEFLVNITDPELEFTFNLQKFSTWLQNVESAAQVKSVEYIPMDNDPSLIPPHLLDAIPFENKTTMHYSTFKQETPQQQELMRISKQFCHSVMSNESRLVMLSGKAGVGKTASAVCAAKELAARGKNIVWISEVMLTGWVDQAKSMADLDNSVREIDDLLSANPDVVVLDDDNLAGYCGRVLLEKIYAWYLAAPGRGLFITSNVVISFQNCYGYKSDKTYHYPPFADYHSVQYLNWIHKTGLAGKSLRMQRDGQSIGAIVSVSAFNAHEAQLGEIELIPAFNESEDLVPIRCSLRSTGELGPAYDKLSPIQQRWISKHKTIAASGYLGNGEPYYIEPYLTVNVNKFEKTCYKTIAVEINTSNCRFFGVHVKLDQLISVLNYAYDKGGVRVILINKTEFGLDDLLIKIKAELPSSEQERTWSRLNLLLCENENTIFDYDQFKGRVEEILLKPGVSRSSPPMGRPSSQTLRRESSTSTFFAGVAGIERESQPKGKIDHSNGHLL
jgi:hypothetical protein